MNTVKENIELGYFTAEAQRAQRFAECNMLPFDSTQGEELISWGGYPPLAACTELAEVEMLDGRRWTVALTHHRGMENTEVRRVQCDFRSALAFGGADSKPRRSKIGKLRRIEEITRPHLDLVKRRTEKGRSLDLLVRFASRQNERENKKKREQ